MNPAEVTTNLHAALDDLAPEPPASPSLFDRVQADVARRRARRASVLCGLVVLVLAGGIGVAARDTPATVAPRVTETSGTTATWAAADADAAQRADAFVVPGPAVRQSAPPPGSQEMAGRMAPAGDRPHTSVVTRWWTVQTAPATLQASLDGYLPAGATAAGSSSGPGSFLRMYSWPDQPAVLVGRQLTVQVDTTQQPMLVRVDAEATWLPTRPATALVPSGTTTITVVLHTKSPGLANSSIPARTFGPVTVTDRAQVDQVVALVNRLPMAAVREGIGNCPADLGGTMEVTFTGPTGIVTARLRLTLSGCRSNQLEMPDGMAVELANDGVNDLGNTIRGLLGLNWTW
ncbi:hypothetical protein ACFO1B_46015 [Dactylosporangium siamense]|uniref:Uncharacterized protein n=1 Tax=Dactylosporangium siamense TaxID=685454 RepID=A0A919PP68_9ACTN|nr:hypothetical protein [Dactylosporangium siamense]GIG45753.1 hypothetical protein Dsi01nite_037940 [Dactylosporangium siamense]